MGVESLLEHLQAAPIGGRKGYIKTGVRDIAEVGGFVRSLVTVHSADHSVNNKASMPITNAV